MNLPTPFESLEKGYLLRLNIRPEKVDATRVNELMHKFSKVNSSGKWSTNRFVPDYLIWNDKEGMGKNDAREAIEVLLHILEEFSRVGLKVNGEFTTFLRIQPGINLEEDIFLHAGYVADNQLEIVPYRLEENDRI